MKRSQVGASRTFGVATMTLCKDAASGFRSSVGAESGQPTRLDGTRQSGARVNQCWMKWIDTQKQKEKSARGSSALVHAAACACAMGNPLQAPTHLPKTPVRRSKKCSKPTYQCNRKESLLSKLRPTFLSKGSSRSRPSQSRRLKLQRCSTSPAKYLHIEGRCLDGSNTILIG